MIIFFSFGRERVCFHFLFIILNVKKFFLLDLQEGVSSEACSLAGHLGLGKIIVLYDDNKITIDGKIFPHNSSECSSRILMYFCYHINFLSLLNL